MAKGLRSRVLPRSFYARSPEIVAPELLGKVLIHQVGKQRLSGRIVETEAYLGLEDPASHAYTGKSAANETLFGLVGRTHVYLSYGVHFCMSLAAHVEGHAGGVLIRALLPVEGVDVMAKLRGRPEERAARWLTGGPGRVCQALGIDHANHNGQDVTRASSAIRVVDDGYRCEAVAVMKRVGITKAAEQPLRFVLRAE